MEPELRALPAHSRFESAPSQPARSESPQPPEAWPAQPAADARPLSANLSLADLERVRKALQLLSDEPDAAPGGAVERDDALSQPGAANTAGGDDEDTTPLPVILPAATAAPRPEVLETPRGPFEPARVASPASVAEPEPGESALPPPGGFAVTGPEVAAVPAAAEPADPPEKLSSAATEKLDQIKDLLITAEAIGEVNLDQHFDRVSQRQRELIREFFERAIPGRDPES